VATIIHITENNSPSHCTGPYSAMILRNQETLLS